MLATPENVVDRSTAVGWTTVSNTTLGNAGATHAILQCYLWGSDNDTSNIRLRLHIRPSDSAAAASELNKVCEVVITDFGSSQSYNADMDQIIVALDSSSDFDYTVVETSTFDGRDIRIELMGYWN